MESEKLFNNINKQLKEENLKYKRLKICKYSFELSKIIILTVSTGLTFISIFAILFMISIPIIDSIKHNSNVDQRIFQSKSKKDLLKELYNYRNQTHKNLIEQEILKQYYKLVNKSSIINYF